MPTICAITHELERVLVMIYNGNRTEWSPVQSVIIPVINKIVPRVGGVRFV